MVVERMDRLETSLRWGIRQGDGWVTFMATDLVTHRANTEGLRELRFPESFAGERVTEFFRLT